MMATEIFNIDASWAEKLMKKRVSFSTAPTVAYFGVFNLQEPQNDITIVSYKLSEKNNALKRKLKIYFSKGPPFAYFQKITNMVVLFLFLTLGSSPIA